MLIISPLPASAQVAGTLVIAGNGPEQATIEALARAFEKANPRAYIDILWDEDSAPVQLVQTGQAQIAVTGMKDATLTASQIGWDGIGILVHLSNFTKELTTQQVADVFSGKMIFPLRKLFEFVLYFLVYVVVLPNLQSTDDKSM